MYGPAELRQLAFLKIAHRLGIPWTPPPCSARLVPGGGAPCGTRSPSWIGSSIRHRTLSGFCAMRWTTVPTGVLLPLLAGGGVALGYGARWAGGCTSGHGLSGCSAGSRDSLAATATFFAVAFAVTFAAQALSGGVL